MKPEAMQNESHVKDAVKVLCKKHKAYYYMPVPTGYGRMGVPDFLICRRGWFVAVETKFASRPTTAHQDRELQAVRAAGGEAYVVNQWDLEDLDQVLGAL